MFELECLVAIRDTIQLMAVCWMAGTNNERRVNVITSLMFVGRDTKQLMAVCWMAEQTIRREE